MSLVHIHNMDELTALFEKEDRVCIIDCYATWCGPCKMIAPLFEDYSNSEWNKYICFVKLDVDVAEDVAEYLQVSAMPTFLAYYKNQKLAEFSGASKDKLQNMVATSVALYKQVNQME